MAEMRMDLIGDLKLNNTEGIKNQVKDLQSAVSSSSILGLQSSNNYNNNTMIINEQMMSLKDTIENVIASFKVFTKELKQNTGVNGVAQNGNSSSQSSANANNIFSRPVQKIIGGALTAGGTALGVYEGYQAYQQSMLQGDFLGAEVGKYKTAGSTLSGVGSSIMGLGIGLAATPLGIPLMVAGGLLSGGGLIANAIGSKKQTEKVSADIYSEALPNMDSLLIGYGVPKDKSGRYFLWEKNAQNAQDRYAKVVANNTGYGLSDAEFSAMVAQMSKYGYSNNLEGAINLVKNAGRIHKGTGADFGSTSMLLGEINRYGGNINDVYRTINSSQSLGFTDGQMQELIEGLQESVSTGISKGFMVSTKDLTNTLAAFTNATTKDGKNDPFWSGKAGLDKVKSLSQGVANATDLGSVNDVLLYQAVNAINDDTLKSELGNSYVKGDRLTNIRTLMSRGKISPTIAKEYLSKLKSIYGNDSASIIEDLTSVMGSRDAAAQFYNMNISDANLYKGPEEYNITKYGFETGSTEAQDAQNFANRQSTTGQQGYDNITKLVPKDWENIRRENAKGNFVYNYEKLLEGIDSSDFTNEDDPYKQTLNWRYQGLVDKYITSGLDPEFANKAIESYKAGDLEKAINRLTTVLEHNRIDVTEYIQ